MSQFHKKHFFYSHGKLLLTGEYLILYGALGLSVPTSKGQSLTVFETKKLSSILHWKSYDQNKLWFEVSFQLPFFKIGDHTDINHAIRLKNLLLKSKKIKSNFLSKSSEIYVETKLEFSRNWGLGSSSTLIKNISKWVKINPYMLLGEDFFGSGYDIACVSHFTPIIYKLNKKNPCVIPVKFNPPFKEKLFFLHLNKKKSTFNALHLFFSKKKISFEKINSISSITLKILFCKKLKEFENLLIEHETIISKILNLPTIKEIYFPDYLGLVKSLGSWGGDFVLISYRKGMKKYFYNKGFQTIISFDEMIL